jgi:hypothetical protein
MRRAIICLSAASMLVAAAAQGRPQHAAPAPSRGGPPHAWLFGTWTGGLFPVLDGMVEQDCRTQPTVAFAKDEVDHASLINTTLSQRIIETVRTTPEGAEFRFTPAAADPAGFGCDPSNALYVARQTENTISFPRCAAFPYPLQRCSGPG